MWIDTAALSPTEISGMVAALGVLIGSITAFIKFGMGERGTLTITQAQGANTILDKALLRLDAEVVRKDLVIAEIRAERDQLREELARCRGERHEPANDRNT